MRGFAQQGLLCSLHSKICWSTFSNTTTRAKVQEPAASENRALINIPLFSRRQERRRSGRRQVCPVCCWAVGEETEREAWDDTPHGYLVYPMVRCCAAWTKHREEPTHPLQTAHPTPPGTHWQSWAAPLLKAFLQGFQQGTGGRCFWEAPASSKQHCCTLDSACCSACSSLSTLGPPTSGWMLPSSSSLWLAEKMEEEEGEGYLRHKEKPSSALLTSCSIIPSRRWLYIDGEPCSSRVHISCLPALQGGCGSQLAVTRRNGLRKGVHFTSLGAVRERTWNPTPLYCWLLFDFHHNCCAAVCPFTSICCGLFGYILAFERCQSAKT